VVLVRLGKDSPGLAPPAPDGLDGVVVRVPRQKRTAVPRYLALADVLVQPGPADAINCYRFPSKLPEFFAMGRPVVLPRANVGLEVEDGEEALLLDSGDAADIAARVERILSDSALASRLAAGARRFAERSFSWPRSAAVLHEFYRRVTSSPAAAGEGDRP
jgi:glycosyltransferase involved in cell wall biosynthesis